MIWAQASTFLNLPSRSQREDLTLELPPRHSFQASPANTKGFTGLLSHNNPSKHIKFKIQSFHHKNARVQQRRCTRRMPECCICKRCRASCNLYNVMHPLSSDISTKDLLKTIDLTSSLFFFHLAESDSFVIKLVQLRWGCYDQHIKTMTKLTSASVKRWRHLLQQNYGKLIKMVQLCSTWG